MKDYLNFEGLTHFFNKLFDKISKLLEDKLSKTDTITTAEIDEICEVTIYNGDEVAL